MVLSMSLADVPQKSVPEAPVRPCRTAAAFVNRRPQRASLSAVFSVGVVLFLLLRLFTLSGSAARRDFCVVL